MWQGTGNGVCLKSQGRKRRHESICAGLWKENPASSLIPAGLCAVSQRDGGGSIPFPSSLCNNHLAEGRAARGEDGWWLPTEPLAQGCVRMMNIPQPFLTEREESGGETSPGLAVGQGQERMKMNFSEGRRAGFCLLLPKGHLPHWRE